MNYVLKDRAQAVSQWQASYHEQLQKEIDLNALKDELTDKVGGLQYIKTRDSVPVQPFPVSEDLYEEIVEAGVKFRDLIRSIPQRLFADDLNKYLSLVGYTNEYVKQNCLIDFAQLDKYEPFFMRPDVLVMNGQPYFLEFNICSAIGGLTEMHLANEVFAQLPVQQEMDRRFGSYAVSPLESLAQSIRRVYMGQEKEPLVAVCEWGEENPRFFVEMVEQLSQYGIRAVFCSPSELTYTEDGIVYQGQRIDDLFWGFAYLEAVDRFDELLHILRAAHEGKLRLLCDFMDEVLSSKANLAFLSDNKYQEYFMAEEQELCDHYIPWTRFLSAMTTEYHGQEIDLVPYLKANKDLFVVKPTTNFGGKGIMIGCQHSQSEWEAFLDERVDQNTYIVQECLRSDRYELAMYTNGELEMRTTQAVLGPYLLGGQGGGCLVRASTVTSGLVINAYNGAQVFHSVIVPTPKR